MNRDYQKLKLTGAIKVCTDSRLIKPGEYFVAIKGENFDGHKFIDEVMEKGAKGVLEESELYAPASAKIRRIKPKIIGVTGSSGKTTVTNFLQQVLLTKYNTCLGYLNTKLGLAVNAINDMSEGCEFFVAEMGMDKAGELTETTEMFPPDIAVITTINHVHLEKLGSVEAIANAKAEILYGLKKNGVAVLNKQNAWVRKIGQKFANDGGKVAWYPSSKYVADIKVPNHLLGEHNIKNALCVGTICRLLGLTSQEITNGLNNLKLPKGRLNVIRGKNGSVLIDDTYNANPESTEYALQVLNDYPGKRKIAILGDMLELGEYSVRDHRNIGRCIKKLKVDLLITVGNKAVDIKESSELKNSFWFDSSDKAQEIKTIIGQKPGDVILIKGSQGVRMERITKELMMNPENAPSLLVRQDVRWITKQ